MKTINCILLIDDNPADNEFHKIIINKAHVCNYIRVVTDGTKALNYIKKSREEGQSEVFPKPDLIFLDINMPGMNGFEFLEEYKKLDDELKSKVVIVMLSTSLNPDDHKKATDNTDVTAFQNKPLDVKTLQETIEKYFQPSQSG